MSLLNKEETLRFLRDVLELPVSEVPCLSNSSLSASQKLSFLETLLDAHLTREPFQSITLMSDEVKDRHRPSWEEMKSNMFLRRGGLCYWHNTFMYVLLDSLGCDVSMSHSTVSGFDSDNHVVVLIRDFLVPGDFYLVDVGIGYYIPRPIPLDFPDESLVYKDSIMTYKLRKESESKISFLKAVAQDTKPSSSNQTEQSAGGVNQDNNNKVADTNKKLEWEVLYFFNPLKVFKNLDEFFPCFDICFTDVTKLPFHTSPRAMHWENGRFLGIVNSKLLEEKVEGELTKTEIIKPASTANPSSTSPDDHVDLAPLLQAYEKFFPQFPSDMVLIALNFWKSSQKTQNPSHVDY